MAQDELRAEIASGVRFCGLFEAPGPGTRLSTDDSARAGVMGIQGVDDVTLIRHAYVRPDRQRMGVGSRLLAHLLGLAGRPPARPLLVGTWAAAWWAVAFYERHGFVLVTPEEKDRLLRRYYWSIPQRQVETSVVLRFVSACSR